jgi:hypothetical protein
MANSLEELAREALRLPHQQRLALADLLLTLEDPAADPEVDAAWEEEIRARIQAVDEGKAVGIPYEEVMREAERRLLADNRFGQRAGVRSTCDISGWASASSSRGRQSLVSCPWSLVSGLFSRPELLPSWNSITFGHA